MTTSKSSSQTRRGRRRATPDKSSSLHRHQIMLDAASAEALRLLGGGNLSAGTRRAAHLIRDFMDGIST
jgi:hypothetical protein